MERITRRWRRYGDPEFDREYMEKGLHDRETQEREADAVLMIAAPDTPLRILDLACGVGTHAIRWAAAGHRVTGIDISETFIAEARRCALDAAVSVDFVVGDIRGITFADEFDLVVWVEKPSFHDGMPAVVYRALTTGGLFIGDLRNPEHPRVQAMADDSCTWREEDGVYFLSRHTCDEVARTREDVWIRIDTESGAVEEDVQTGDIRSCASRTLGVATEELPKAGFKETELRTMEGEVFTGGERPYWLWIVARK